MTIVWGLTSINHFKNLHDYYLKKKPIVHAYATPYDNDPTAHPAAKWYHEMHEKRDLVRMGFQILQSIHKVILRITTMISVT